ncbi:MAG: hypothetical protein MPN21_18025 [Thermoanaerobaculia bacterium]|nr:hypothetical protein [Thermoanaerobaculia bacterium]
MGLRRKAAVVAVNLALFLLLAEVVSLGAYAWQTGALYYTHEPDRSVPKSSERVDDFRLHPYFGYVWRPWLRVHPQRNNHGFVSPHDYPLATSRTVIGIFGGSLAANLATYDAEHDVLRPRLARRLGREPDELQVLNFAQAGYKQPQQLLVATYFRALGQRLDLAINLDGFNEVTLATANALDGWHLAMPSLSHIGPLHNVVEFTGSSSDALSRMVKIRKAWDGFPTGTSAPGRAEAGRQARQRVFFSTGCCASTTCCATNVRSTSTPLR